MYMSDITEIFGSLVFNDCVMKEKLPEDTYKNLKNTVDNGEPLSTETANVVANAMKDWAIEKGATHFTHWFQPMTEVTAEKHDSFISPAEDRLGSYFVCFCKRQYSVYTNCFLFIRRRSA